MHSINKVDNAQIMPLPNCLIMVLYQFHILIIFYDGRRCRPMEALRYHRFMKASAKSRTTKPQSLAPTESVFFSDFFFFFKFTHKKNKNKI